MAVSSNGNSTNGATAVTTPERRRLDPGMAEDENTLEGPLFNPPVYQQRYETVKELLRQIQPRKVVDMGCAECKLLRLLKFENCIEELIGVDMDADIMYRNRRRLEPLNADYIFRRPRPLRIRLMKGSISDPDPILRDTDLFSCIEVIEHLEEPVLSGVPGSVFGTIRPSVAIFSTPNAEFNVLFPNFSGFRHPDHKFEWTRRQFQHWCNNICNQYGYEVRFTGVGEPPRNRSNLGHCSQIAIFTQPSDTIPPANVEWSTGFRSNYELIFECIYPNEVNTVSASERLSNESQYYIQVLVRSYQQGQLDREANEETREVGGALAHVEERESLVRAIGSDFDPEGVVFIRLDDLLRFSSVRRLSSDVDDIRHALTAHSNYEIRSHEGNHYVIIEADNNLSLSDDDERGEESDNGVEDEVEGSSNGDGHDITVEHRNGIQPEDDWDND